MRKNETPKRPANAVSHCINGMVSALVVAVLISIQWEHKMKRKAGLHPAMREFENCRQAIANRKTHPDFEEVRGFVLEGLAADYPRFYLPPDVDILPEQQEPGKLSREIDMRSPFPAFILLAPIYFSTEAKPGPMILIVQQTKENPSHYRVMQCNFIERQGVHLWGFTPAVITVEINGCEFGFRFHVNWDLSEDPTYQEKIFNNANVLAGRLMNFCALAALHNVTMQEHEPPEKLNRQRIKSNVLPLRSFFTLIVDGEHWDGVHSNQGSGSGVRSHYRRGHPRRLSAEKSVWVRSTTVHGRRPGFVTKDYEIKPPNNP